MILELPWPPTCLSPNGRNKVPLRNFMSASKAYRTFCWAIAMEAKAKGRITKIQFFPPDKRARDDDNMIASFKHGRDGIALATKIDDKHYRPTYEILEPVAGGKIIVTLGE